MIKLKDISFSYGNYNVIDKFSYNFDKGKSYVILGKSGCGKTTLLYLLDGLLKPNNGTITIGDKPLNGVNTQASLILQNHGLFPWLTVKKNCLIGLKNKENEFNEIIESVGIESIVNHYPSMISGGQKQRTAIARSLLRHSEILLMDEMSASLDSFTQETIQQEVLKLYHTYKFTMILVTHNIEEALIMGQTIIIMDKGKFIKVIDNPGFLDKQFRDSYDFNLLSKEIRGIIHGL